MKTTYPQFKQILKEEIKKLLVEGPPTTIAYEWFREEVAEREADPENYSAEDRLRDQQEDLWYRLALRHEDSGGWSGEIPEPPRVGRPSGSPEWREMMRTRGLPYTPEPVYERDPRTPTPEDFERGILAGEYSLDEAGRLYRGGEEDYRDAIVLTPPDRDDFRTIEDRLHQPTYTFDPVAPPAIARQIEGPSRMQTAEAQRDPRGEQAYWDDYNAERENRDQQREGEGASQEERIRVGQEMSFPTRSTERDQSES